MSANDPAATESEAGAPLQRAIDELRDELLSWIDAELDRLQYGDVHGDRSAASRPTRSPIVVPIGDGPAASSSADADSHAGDLNPRQRLDALARTLDRRLKQTDGATGT